MKKVLVIMPPSVTGTADGRIILNQAQAYVKSMLEMEVGETNVEFLDGLWQNISVNGVHQNSARMGVMFGRVADSDFVFFTHGWEKDPACQLIKSYCEDSMDGISHAAVQFFRR